MARYEDDARRFQGNEGNKGHEGRECQESQMDDKQENNGTHVGWLCKRKVETVGR